MSNINIGSKFEILLIAKDVKEREISLINDLLQKFLMQNVSPYNSQALDLVNRLTNKQKDTQKQLVEINEWFSEILKNQNSKEVEI